MPGIATEAAVVPVLPGAVKSRPLSPSSSLRVKSRQVVLVSLVAGSSCGVTDVLAAAGGLSTPSNGQQQQNKIPTKCT